AHPRNFFMDGDVVGGRADTDSGDIARISGHAPYVRRSLCRCSIQYLVELDLHLSAWGVHHRPRHGCPWPDASNRLPHGVAAARGRQSLARPPDVRTGFGTDELDAVSRGHDD